MVVHVRQYALGCDIGVISASQGGRGGNGRRKRIGAVCEMMSGQRGLERNLQLLHAVQNLLDVLLRDDPHVSSVAILGMVGVAIDHASGSAGEIPAPAVLDPALVPPPVVLTPCEETSVGKFSWRRNPKI